MHMGNNTKWMSRWNTWVAPTRLPGVFQRQEGGHLVRARVVDPTTGKKKEIRKVLPKADAVTALKWLEDEKNRIKSGTPSATPQKTRFAEYAASLFERKVTRRDIKSARGRERWEQTLRHLIGGTRGVKGFGEMFMDQIRPAHIDDWQTGIARLITAGDYRPASANGWLGILKLIFKSAKRDLGLASNPTEGVRCFDTSEHPAYTEEEPNTLNADEAHEFFDCMRSDYPQHFAMTYLGIALGLRPSSMRPLRRQGPTPDVLWDQNVILVRRSHTLGNEVMNCPKTGRRQRISVPPELMQVLRWHVETQLGTPEQQEPELLFPAEDGGFRNEHCLRMPFAEVRKLIGRVLRLVEAPAGGTQGGTQTDPSGTPNAKTG